MGLGSLTVVPGKLIVDIRKAEPVTHKPQGAIALDTNEDSLDGVYASGDSAMLLRVPFDGVRRIQAVHFRRRRRLARKKACDRRVLRHLLGREGRREKNRVHQRLHQLSKHLVQFANNCRMAIVLEELRLPAARSHSRMMNRRLCSWPRSEIHGQIEYKAALAGVPVIKVNPAWAL